MSTPPDPSQFPDLARLGASMLGSFVSLKFVQGSAMERLFMFVGGAGVSFYSTPPLANWIGGSGLEGMVGFFSGLLGMTVVAKVYEVISTIDVKDVTETVKSWIKRKWGA